MRCICIGIPQTLTYAVAKKTDRSPEPDHGPDRRGRGDTCTLYKTSVIRACSVPTRVEGLCNRIHRTTHPPYRHQSESPITAPCPSPYTEMEHGRSDRSRNMRTQLPIHKVNWSYSRNHADHACKLGFFIQWPNTPLGSHGCTSHSIGCTSHSIAADVATC